MAKYRIRFLPMDKIFPAKYGDNLLEVAMMSGVHINASCGGNGACGKCRVVVKEGSTDSAPHLTITRDEYNEGVRLACMTALRGDVTVEVPLESQVDRSALKRRVEAPHILAPSDAGKLVAAMEIDPAVFKRCLKLPEPTAEDNIADLSRLLREIKTRYGIDDVSADYRVLKKLSRILRADVWRVTVTLGPWEDGYRLINVEAGDKEQENYAVLLDIGTTTVCGQLLDLGKCATPLCVLSDSSDYNGQISFGEDVISRIVFSRKKGGLRKLQEAVISSINRVIGELLDRASVNADLISHVTLAGNTTMTHLLLGLDPTYIMRAPYTPTTVVFPPVRLAGLGVNLNDHAHAYIFPSVASYVGGDIVAGVLGSGMFQREEVTLFMDIGTNGEIVLGNKDWLTCASCSAGPAFEGGGIQFGMRAGKGAIEQVHINPSTYEPMILTVGRHKPMGICGSGLIDIVAGLLEAGLIDQRGKFLREGAPARVRPGENGYEYVLSYAPETEIGKDIVITEIDLDNLIRTKAAIYAGFKVLLDNLGLSVSDIEKVIIAGGFGHYIDLEKAIFIGLLPELPPRKFLFIGNGALLGARLVSLSKGILKETGRIARMMTNIELSVSPRFMDEFMAAQFLPHTDHRAFPRTTERLRKMRSGNQLPRE